MTLFDNYIIDLEKGIIYSKHFKRMMGGKPDKKGYIQIHAIDNFGNKYTKIHQVILAEGLQLPKHLWPVDENGNRYVTDHILPINDGGTNSFSNLRLVSILENNKNPITKKHQSESLKGKHRSEDVKRKISEGHKGQIPWNKGLKNGSKSKTVYQYTLDGELVKVWESTKECKRNGFHHVADCCRGKRKQDKGHIWSYTPL